MPHMLDGNIVRGRRGAPEEIAADLRAEMAGWRRLRAGLGLARGA